MADALSEVLRAVRLTGAVFFAIDASSPWVAEAPPAAKLAPHVLPGAEHVIEYHLVVSGECWGGLIGEESVRLEAGDVIAFPQGDAHLLASRPGLRGGPSVQAIVSANRPALPVPIRLDGGSGEPARVICGFIGCDARPFNPLLASLPRCIHLGRASDGGEIVRHLVDLAVAETNARHPGGETMLARLSELLFVELVRRHVASLAPEARGWFAGLRDAHVGRALAELHARPTEPWTLEELARACGTSRSVLAERFATLVGRPPMQYLGEWRIQLAANLLRTTTKGVAEIADRVGYGSEAALSRAFKRRVGVAPATYRRGGT